MKHQEVLQQWYTGGTVFHIDTGSAHTHPDAVKNIIKGTLSATKLPYVTWSPTYTVCPTHGQTSGKQACCAEGITYSRIVGFYRPVSRWNKGKTEEFKTKKFTFVNLMSGHVISATTEVADQIREQISIAGGDINKGIEQSQIMCMNFEIIGNGVLK
jgi:hypothetical protein